MPHCRLFWLAAPFTALLLAVACSSGSSKNTPATAPGIAATQAEPAASAAAQPLGATIDGIPCETSERLTYHVHAHLTIIANGQSVIIPANTGIVDNRCLYWLHTHDTTGVIHIEAPAPREFSLGNFFDIWRQPLSATQVAGFAADAGHNLQFFVNGQQYNGDPRQIPLTAHGLITIEYGPPFPPAPPFPFPPGL